MNRLLFALVSIVSFSVMSAQAAPTVETFDDPVVTGAAQAPGVWYTDRYAPANFSSPTFFDGGNRLLHSISSADGGSSRPSGFSGAFYNTQGRKYDLSSGITTMSIDLYVPAGWQNTNERMAGFWGTAFDSGDTISAYPILEFTSDGGTPRFRMWDNDHFEDMGLPTGFFYDEWYTLGIELLGNGEFRYTVGDLTLDTTDVGVFNTEDIGNVILQGHNTTAGVSYDIYWDNLTTDVPEPGSLALLGLGGLLVARRRR